MLNNPARETSFGNATSMKETTMNIKRFLVVLLGISLVVQGCTTIAQTINWNGTWTGTWRVSGTLPCGSAFTTGGDATLILSVTNNVVSGTESYTGEYCYD